MVFLVLPTRVKGSSSNWCRQIAVWML